MSYVHTEQKTMTIRPNESMRITDETITITQLDVISHRARCGRDTIAYYSRSDEGVRGLGTTMWLRVANEWALQAGHTWCFVGIVVVHLHDDVLGAVVSPEGDPHVFWKVHGLQE